MRTYEELKEFVKNLCADEADMLMDMLPLVLKSKKSNNKIIRRERKNVICPYCFSNNIYKNGKTKEQKQRYLCRNCKKIFLIITIL